MLVMLQVEVEMIVEVEIVEIINIFICQI